MAITIKTSAEKAFLNNCSIELPFTNKARQLWRGLSLHKETAVLLVHGMLHRMGYDHALSPADTRRMKAKEREVLSPLPQNC
jgi:ssRNA-specific RNase YbeY (16S rRNA maturation enzyme)